MNENNNFLNNELLFNKKRKLDKGKEEESYTELTVNHKHKPQTSLLRKRISESEFNFNLKSSDILNHSLNSKWDYDDDQNKFLPPQYQNSISYQNDNSKIVVNEPPDVPIIEEFDEQNDAYPFFNTHTLQYEFSTEGMTNNASTSNSYNNSNYTYPSSQEINGDVNGPRSLHKEESSLVPFKQGSQIILFNNNSTGQVVLYNKTSKSLSIHKVRPKEIISRNKRCILCNQLLPTEREGMSSDNMFKNAQTYTDAKYFRLLACSLSYSKKPSITSASSSNDRSSSPPMRSINSAENIINLLNDNSSNNTRYLNAHPALTISSINSNVNSKVNSTTNSYSNLKNLNKNDKNDKNNKNEIKEVKTTSTTTTNENEKNTVDNGNEGETSTTQSQINNSNETGNSSTTYLSSSSFNNGYYERFFIERKKLGRGFRGSVFLCHHVLDQVFLGEYAIKKVAVGNNHQWLVRMLKEVMLLEKLRNPNIIEYKHAWLEEHTLSLFGPKVPCLFILMERANGGNLEEYVQLQWNPEEQLEKVLSVKERIKRKRLQMKAAQNQVKDNRAQYFGGIGYDSFGKRVRYLTTEAIWKIFLDICYGLNHLHELGIIHRDLKPPNLLLQYKDPNNQEEIPKVLISDFGECEILSHIEKRQRTGATGTLEFMAPELLISDETGHYYDDYSSNSDLWSLGVVLYYICFSEMPYSQVDDIDILKNEILNLTTVQFKNDNNSNRVPKELKSLIKKLMVKVPTARPKAREILDLYGGYKDGTPIKISTNDASRNNSGPNSSSSSTGNINIKITETKSNENLCSLKDGKSQPSNAPTTQIDNNYLSPTTPNNYNSIREKKKEDEKYQQKSTIKNGDSLHNNQNNNLNNNNNNNNSNENNNNIIDKNVTNNINNNETITILKTNDKNHQNNDDNNDEEDDDDDKELVDEPITFKAEKRIVPFNHNRSKSLSFLPNTIITNYQYSRDQQNNNTLNSPSMFDSPIEEEVKKDETNNNNNNNNNRNANINNSNNNNKEKLFYDPPDNYRSEKSLVPFHNYKYFDRPYPSSTYPPLKNNDKEEKSASFPRAISPTKAASTTAIEKYDFHQNEDWINEAQEENEREKMKKNETSSKGIRASSSKPRTLWEIISQKILNYLANENGDSSNIAKNKSRIRNNPSKTKNSNKKHSHSRSSSYRHTYQNSKIYFSRRYQNQAKFINQSKKNLNINSDNHINPVNQPNQISRVNTLSKSSKPNKLNSRNENKLLKILNQKNAILNIVLFILKSLILYQTIYPYNLFFYYIIISLVLYKSNILKMSILQMLLYSIVDIAFIYLVKTFYIP